VDAGGHASPKRQRRESLPERVTVTSTSTAWAVGSFPTTSGNHSLILQWNGSAWVRVVWGLEHRGEYAGSVGQNVRESHSVNSAASLITPRQSALGFPEVGGGDGQLRNGVSPAAIASTSTFMSNTTGTVTGPGRFNAPASGGALPTPSCR
jgi:hypothetical protein